MSNKNMTKKQISIITAAIDIFSQKGYSATTTSEIAQKAGVAEGTIFHHYKTKKDLLLSIPEYMFQLPITQSFLENMNRIFDKPSKNFEDFLRELINNRKVFVIANVNLIKVLYQEMLFHLDFREKILHIILFPVMDKISKVLNNLKKRGQIAEIPNDAIMNLIFTSISGYFFSHYIMKIELDCDDCNDVDYLVKYIMNGICRNNSN